MGATTIAAAGIAALGVLLTALSLNVSRLRLRHRVSYGDGGHHDLLVAVRLHGNGLEQALLFAVLALAYALLPGASRTFMAAATGVFVLARTVQVVAVLSRWRRVRQTAHAVSTAVHLALALAIGAAVA
jgi:uncharacterized membrane protein YecN with MAPEG domain